MKSILTLVALVTLAVGSTANAASLHVVTTNGGATNAIYLDGETQNGTFNTVIFSAVPNGAATFQALSSGVGKPAGDPNTYRNRALDADPLDGGLGWSLVGTQTTASALTFSGGPLGSNITTADAPGGRLFLGNVQLPTGPGMTGTATVTLVDGTGAQVGDILSATFPIPEPASLGLVGMSTLALAAFRRRAA